MMPGVLSRDDAPGVLSRDDVQRYSCPPATRTASLALLLQTASSLDTEKSRGYQRQCPRLRCVCVRARLGFVALRWRLKLILSAQLENSYSIQSMKRMKQEALAVLPVCIAMLFTTAAIVTVK